jgi:hypothetical protein
MVLRWLPEFHGGSDRKARKNVGEHHFIKMMLWLGYLT